MLLYVGLFVAVMAVAVSIPVWRETDCWIYALLNRGPSIPVAQDLVLVDVPYSETLRTFRQRVTGLLNTIAGRPEALLPKLVVLDISIAADTEGLTELQAAVERLQAAKVNVYAAVDPRDKGKMDQLDPGYMAHHAQSFYNLLDGKGHTKFHHIYNLVWYDPKLEIPIKVQKESMGSELLEALPLLIATKDYQTPETTTSGPPIIVNIGKLNDLRDQTFTFQVGNGFTHYQPDGGSAASAEPDFKNKLVIVASLDAERPGMGELSRPEVLAFAISERILHGSIGERPKLLANTGLLLVLVAGFAALAVALFWLLFRKLKRFRSRLWVPVILSVGICLSGLALWVFGLSMLKNTYPQVTLVGIGIIVSTGLSWFYTRRGLELKLIAPPTDKPEPGAEELPQYDVFISYARTAENLAWVKANVYERLLKECNADGSALRVFFDQRSIDPGEDFYKELALAIQGSRFFLPVYTLEYFTRPFCKFEMQRAALRHVQLGDVIVAIAREAVQIPIQFDHINYVDVKAAPDFMDRVVERIRKREEAQPGG
jgi:hypothetical protein